MKREGWTWLGKPKKLCDDKQRFVCMGFRACQLGRGKKPRMAMYNYCRRVRIEVVDVKGRRSHRRRSGILSVLGSADAAT